MDVDKYRQLNVASPKRVVGDIANPIADTYLEVQCYDAVV